MPRFTDRPWAAPPDPLPPLELEISGHGGSPVVVTGDDLERLGSRDFVADFHCVTTWSVTNVTWTGVPLRDVFASHGITDAPTPFLEVRTADRRTVYYLWEDATADNVVLATHLDGAPLGARHGGTLRLVAPDHYGYKSPKHLVAIEFVHEVPKSLGKMHLRARVALEERHPKLPSSFVRTPYRLTIPLAARLAERSARNTG
jgi:DMSO/TMAO reductase YedYZ molybdopterin-dependent catalytic subunit